MLFRVRSPRRLRRAALLLMLLAMPPLGAFSHRADAQSPAPRPVPPDEWIGIYMGRQKVGYSSTRFSAVTYLGRPALRMISRGVTRMQLLGSTVEQDEQTETISDAKDRPLLQKYNVKSNGSTIQVDAVFDYARGKVHCTIGQGAAASIRDLDIPAGAHLESDSSNLIEGQKPAVGQKFVAMFLEPLSVQLQEAKVEVVGRETVRSDDGRQVPSFRMTTAMPLGQMTSWVDADGHAIRSEINLGALSMVMVSESKTHALSRAAISPALSLPSAAGAKYIPPADFAVATAIATARHIVDPRSVQHLQVDIDGIPSEGLILSDARQKETVLNLHPAPPYEVTAAIDAGRIEPGAIPALPISDSELAKYLRPAPYLPVNDANIRRTAVQVRAGRTDPYRVALSLRDWVHAAMTPDPSIGVPRSASDIFARRRGVCRDYATLYTALARAAGVPTRLCSGIVYAELQGKAGFYYHAWAESWVGRWVAVDPTLYDPSHPVDYVDATHIKFAEGDVTQMFQMVSIVGRLKITVQDEQGGSPAPK